MLDCVQEKEGNWLMVEGARLEDGGEYTCHISAFQPSEVVHSVLIRTRWDDQNKLYFLLFRIRMGIRDQYVVDPHWFPCEFSDPAF